MMTCGLLYWAVVTMKLAFRVVVGEKNQNLNLPPSSQLRHNCVLQLQHSEEAQSGDLNHTAALVTENIFLQGPSTPLVVLQGRIEVI